MTIRPRKPRRKAEIVRQVNDGLLPPLLACLGHDLSPDELYGWIDQYRAGGERGLRVNLGRCKR